MANIRRGSPDTARFASAEQLRHGGAHFRRYRRTVRDACQRARGATKKLKQTRPPPWPPDHMDDSAPCRAPLAPSPREWSGLRSMARAHFPAVHDFPVSASGTMKGPRRAASEWLLVADAAVDWTRLGNQLVSPPGLALPTILDLCKGQVSASTNSPERPKLLALHRVG
jgi:hypothetical protein